MAATIANPKKPPTNKPWTTTQSTELPVALRRGLRGDGAPGATAGATGGGAEAGRGAAATVAETARAGGGGAEAGGGGAAGGAGDRKSVV